MFEWEERFEVGIESIDKAHQEMFKMFNRIQSQINYGANAGELAGEYIKFFMNYAEAHFEDEESWMESVGYARLEEHKAIHVTMRSRILPEIYSELELSGYSREAVEKFLRICDNWLRNHILGHDLDLVKWIEEP